MSVVGFLGCGLAGFVAGTGVGVATGLGAIAGCGFALCCTTGLAAGVLGGCGCG